MYLHGPLDKEVRVWVPRLGRASVLRRDKVNLMSFLLLIQDEVMVQMAFNLLILAGLVGLPVVQETLLIH